MSAYAQLGLFDNQVQRLAADDRTSLPVQYHALNAIRHICDDYIDDNNQLKIRADLQNILLRKIQNQANKNAVRIWAFDALFTPFIYNPEDGESALGDNLEKSLSDIVNQPLNQVKLNSSRKKIRKECIPTFLIQCKSACNPNFIYSYCF